MQIDEFVFKWPDSPGQASVEWIVTKCLRVDPTLRSITNKSIQWVDEMRRTRDLISECNTYLLKSFENMKIEEKQGRWVFRDGVAID